MERVIGAIRRECLGHVIVFNETSLGRILSRCLSYYHRSRITSLWIRTHRKRVRCSRPTPGTSSPSLKSAVSIIATSRAQLETRDYLTTSIKVAMRDEPELRGVNVPAADDAHLPA